MAIAFIDSVASTNLGINGGSTPAVDTTGATLIVVAVGRFSAGSVSDSEGNTWTLLHTETEGSTGLDWYYAIGPTVSATHTFTYTGADTYPSVLASAFSGDNIALGQKASSSATATSAAPGSLTPANDNSLVISAIGHNLSEAQAVTESLTIRENNQQSSGNQLGCAIADIVQTTATAINPSWSSAASGRRAVAQAIFFESSTRLPLVIIEGQVQQLPTGDSLELSDDVVTAASDFGTDDVLIVSNGTEKGVEASSIAAGDVVQAASAFGTDNAVLRADGTGRGAQSSTVTIDDDGRLLAFYSGGTNNIVISGDDSLASQTSGSSNIAVGDKTLEGITSGSFNVAIGQNAIQLNTNGSSNVGVGVNALQNVDGSSGNFGLGTAALRNYTTGSGSIAIGVNALLNHVVGGGQTAIGQSAGRTVTSGGNNTFIGNVAGFDASQIVAPSNSTAIGNGAFTTASNQVSFGNDSVTETILRGGVLVRRGTNAQSLEVFETFTSASNFESVRLYFSSNVARLETRDDGTTGSASALALGTDSTVRTQIGPTGVVASGSCFQPGHWIAGYGAGTNYTLTATYAEVDRGTTDSAIVLDQPGTYKIIGRMAANYDGTNFSGGEAINLKLRRTNNTAADLTNSETTMLTFDDPSGTVGVMAATNEVFYTTANSDDRIAIFAALSATPSSGTVAITADHLVAERVA